MTLPWLNPWFVLVIAGLFEVGWASGLTHLGPQRPWLSLLGARALAASM